MAVKDWGTVRTPRAVHGEGAYSRRRLIAGLAAPLPLVLAAACGGPSGESSGEVKAGPKQTIEWWTGWGGTPANESFAKIQEAANAQSTAFEVRHLRVSGVGTKLAEAIVAGSPPDVEVGNLPYAEFWVKGYA